MEIDDIKQLVIPAADDCILYMWSTIPHLANAIDVMRAWNFTYKTNRVWVKFDRPGTGYRVREQHEHLLIGVRGAIPAALSTERVSSVLYAPRPKRHSEKPTAIHEWIESEYPELRKLEMFARTQRPGWTAWGNQIELMAAG